MKKVIIFLVLFLYMLMLENALAVDSNETLNINIISPESKVYNNSNVLLNLTTNKYSNINYNLNNNVFPGCDNCTQFTQNLNLLNGTYTLTAFAISEDETANDTVEFSVNIPEEVNLTTFNLIVNKPENITYNTTTIPVNIKTSLIANLSYILDSSNETSLCNQCESYVNDLTNVPQGSHMFKVIALRGNETLNKEINFNVNLQVLQNNTTTRFSTGFQKLPKDFASGQVSKAELLNILDNNQLPPGIINRLLKTGLLDKEIIDKIIETQSLQPYGIYRRLNNFLGLFGYGKNTLVDELMDKYNLTENQTSKILKNYKLPPGTIKKIIATNKLTGKNINDLVSNQKLNNKNINKILNDKSKISKDTKDKLIENQEIDEKNIDKIVEDDPELIDKAVKKQKINEKKKEELTQKSENIKKNKNNNKGRNK